MSIARPPTPELLRTWQSRCTVFSRWQQRPGSWNETVFGIQQGRQEVHSAPEQVACVGIAHERYPFAHQAVRAQVELESKA